MNAFIGYGDSRQILRTRCRTVQLPVDNEWIAEHIAQEAEARDDRRVTEIVGRDVDDGDGECIAAFRPVNVDRPVRPDAQG